MRVLNAGFSAQLDERYAEMERVGQQLGLLDGWLVRLVVLPELGPVVYHMRLHPVQRVQMSAVY